jgi:serine/threonine protein kinase
MAKVLDFGVAKGGPGRDGADPSEVTRKGIAVGTPEYLAPEIFRGGPGTPKTDQYSLGILLYAALTGGRKPFTAEKSDQFGDLHLWQAIMKGEYPGVRVYRSEIPAGLEAVIERAMHRDPEQRFRSVHSLGEALLPWASPRARLQWTGHFTSTPKAVPLQSSMAIRASTGDLDPEKAHGTATGPTVPAAAARSGAQGSAELTTIAKAGAREKTHGPPPESRRVGTDQSESSLSLSIEEASVASAVRSTSSVSLSAADLIPTGDVRVPVFRRPMFIVGAAAAALGVALVIALLLRGSSPRTAPRTTAPDEIVRRADPHPNASVVAPTAAPTPAPAPVGQPTEEVVRRATDAVPSEPAQQSGPATEKRASPRRHRKKPSVDQNGIGIPAD